MKKIHAAIPLGVAIILLIYPFAVYSGSQILVVSSDSMFPTLNPNDIIIVEPVGIDEINKGDIIAFDSHTEGIGIIAHRVVDVFEQGDEIGIDTKGDHLDEPDLWTVLDEDLVGLVTDVNPDSAILLAEPVRYLLVAVIMVTGVLLVRESIPRKGLEVKQLTCLRCGNRWHPRIIDGKVKIPETCPNKNCTGPVPDSISMFFVPSTGTFN